MTEDIRDLLDRASTGDAYAFDTDAVVRKGKSRRRRRMYGMGGAATLGVAAITALTVALASANGGGAGTGPGGNAAATGGSPTGSETVNAQEYTLPTLDPAKTYYWNSAGRQDDAVGTQITASVLAYVNGAFPDAKAIQNGPEFEDDGVSYQRKLVAPGAEGSLFQVAKYTNSLVEVTVEDGSWTPGASVHDEPVYRLRTGDASSDPVIAEMTDSMTTLDHYSGLSLVQDGTTSGKTDLLRLALYPAGGYKDGTDPSARGLRQPVNGYLAEGCDSYDMPGQHGDGGRRFSFDCVPSTGPNGEQIMAITMHEKYLGAGADFLTYTVVVKRTDGTAVVVGSTVSQSLEWKQGEPAPKAPWMSIADLTGMALAVPMVPIA